ncbi:restriction endonuclease subunit S [Lactobacillus iners]|uniref:restriction endonuclease subunit S n=1 Tax=Lactobacillus iners TaxID=147802 RepID=UPI001F09DBDC|nr:restriction endonuclease subunit S [Lactobacillus iners]MCT7834644.1 restriction endonuclease subunit S [Lactobacillus iners]MCT7836564.1 restriction endonuclease subunit S [Lactobacillus iners]
METWKTMTLSDVCYISSSKRIFAKEYQSSGIPFYRGKEIIEKHNGISISNKLFISSERYEEIKNKFGVPLEGDILLTSVGTLGIPWLVDKEKFYFKDGNLTWLRNNELITPRFLYYWLITSQAQNQINSKCIGSTQKALTIEILKKFYITFPDIKTQKKITSIIESIELKIDNNRKINKNLLQQAQALYKDRFVELRPFNGEMPPDWHLGEVSEIIELHDSKRIPLSSRERATLAKLYPYYGATSVMDYVDRYLFDGIYLLLGEDGTVVDNNGFPILQYVEGKFWVNNHAHIITGKNGFTVEMLYLLFSLTNVQSIITGAVQPKISQTNLNKMPIVIPSKAELSDFNSVIQPIFAQIRNLRAQNNRLVVTRDTLLPRLMSGELDVSNLDL